MFDIPEDANPAQVYGTVEFERARLSHLPPPARRAAPQIGECLSPSEALVRFRAARDRMFPSKVNIPVRTVAPCEAAPKRKAKRPEAPPPAAEPAPVPHERDWMFVGERLTVDRVVRVVAHHYGVSRKDLISQRRTADVVRPRQVAMYVSKILTPRSFPQIGIQIGGRDHTTIMHGYRLIASMIEAGDEKMIADVAAIRTILGARDD